MPFQRPDLDIYKRAPTDPMLHTRNFFLQYQEFIDRERAKYDFEEYRKALSAVQQAMRGINFKQNLLFICKEMLHKEIFFTGLSTMDRYLSYRLCNIENIQDVWWGNHREENLQTEQDLNQRVLCVYGDRSFWVNEACGQIANTVVCSRISGNSSDNSMQYTWFFYRGTVDDMYRRNINDKEPGWPYVLDLYKSMRDCMVVDLNKDMPRFVQQMETFNSEWSKKRLGIAKEQNPDLFVPSSVEAKINGVEKLPEDLDY